MGRGRATATFQCLFEINNPISRQEADRDDDKYLHFRFCPVQADGKGWVGVCMCDKVELLQFGMLSVGAAIRSGDNHARTKVFLFSELC